MKPETISEKTSVKTCALDGIYATDSLLYAQIYASLSAPDWAGYNLDALFDILTTEIEGPLEITWDNFEQVETDSVSMNIQIANLLKEAAEDRPDLTLTFS